MARTRAEMQRLMEVRERLLKEIADQERTLEALRNKLAGIDVATAAMSGTSSPDARSTKVRRGRNVKATVLGIITDIGRAGVTAGEVVERGAAKGRQLNVGSVSSLLSRLKREGTLTFDGERYFPAAPKAALTKAGDVLELPRATRTG